MIKKNKKQLLELGFNEKVHNVKGKDLTYLICNVNNERFSPEIIVFDNGRYEVILYKMSGDFLDNSVKDNHNNLHPISSNIIKEIEKIGFEFLKKN